MKDSRVAFEDVRLFVLFFKTRNTTLALIFCSCGYDQRRDVMIFCSSTMFWEICPPLVPVDQVISAQQLPKVSEKSLSVVDPLVRVEIHGVPADTARRETKHVQNNGTVAIPAGSLPT